MARTAKTYGTKTTRRTGDRLSRQSRRQQEGRQDEGLVQTFVSRLREVPSRFMQPRLVLLVSATLLLLFGLLMVFSSSAVMAQSAGEHPTYYLVRQLVSVALGLVLFIPIFRGDYHYLVSTFLPAIWVVSVGMLMVTLGLGTLSHGATRWITIIPGLSLQPSEFAKPVIVLTAANIAQRYFEDGDLELKQAGLLFCLGVGVPLVLILLQPDKGTTMIVFITIMAMMYLAGVPSKSLLIVLAAGVLVILVLSLRDEYSRARILTMLDPFRDPLGAGYQLIQGFYAFGTGGLFGLGIGLSRQKYSYLPEAHNDLIFAIVGEETGLLGTLGVVAGFALFIWAGMKIARYAPDLSGRLLAAGCTTLIAVQFLVNVGGVLGLIPLTGKPLPFLSYGGSSIISTLVIVACIASVSRSSVLPQTEHDLRRASLRLAEASDEAGFEDYDPSNAFDSSQQGFGQRSGLRLVDGSRERAGGYRRIDLGPSTSERLRGSSNNSRMWRR